MNLKKFGAGLFLQVAIKISAAGLGFFTTRWLITILSMQDYATYNLILSYNSALIMGLWFGIPQLLQKYFTNEEDNFKLERVWTTFAVFRFLSYFIGILIILLTFKLSQTNELGFILGIYTAQFILIADFAYRSVCDAMGTAWKFSATDFLGKFTLVLLLSIGSSFAVSDNKLLYFILASITSYALSLFVDAVWNRKHIRFGTFDPSILQTNIKPIIFLSISYVSYALYFTTVPLFIKQFGYDATVVNSYANAYKLFEITAIIPGLTMPTIASLVKSRMKKHQTILSYKNFEFINMYLEKYSNYVIYLEWLCVSLLIGIGSTLGLFIFGPFVIRLVDPNLSYPLAIPALKLISLATIPQSIMYLTSTLNILASGEKFELIASVILATCALSLYILLIPPFGIFGAVWAIIITFCIDFVLKLYFVNKTLLSKPKIFDQAI